MRRTDRLAAILAALDADGSIDVAELADRLSVSAATLRRDLALLEEERLLARTHGGAVTTGVDLPGCAAGCATSAATSSVRWPASRPAGCPTAPRWWR